MHVHAVRFAILVAALLFACCPSADAQIFGNRPPSTAGAATSGQRQGSLQQGLSLGQPSGLGTGSQSFGSRYGLGGNVRAADRYSRSGRGAGNFIGALEPGGGFVGLQQSETAPAARSAVTAAPAPPTRVNRVPTASTSQNRPYAPRLRVDFDRPAVAATALAGTLSNRLAGLLNQNRVQGQLELAVEDSTAILRGTVASTKQRTLVEQLVRLEPGVGQVRNELQVTPPAASPSAARP